MEEVAYAGEMTFPILKVQSIVNCLAELNIPITPAHIKEPQPAHLRGIYETIIETITGANLDAVKQNFQIPFSALEGFQHPQLHDKSLMGLVLDTVIIRTMHAAGVLDFSMADIYHPTFKRVKTHLSALINLCKFWAEQHAIYQDMLEETDAINLRKNALEDENDNFIARIHETKRLREEQAPVVEQLEKEIQELMAQINQLNTEQASLQETIQTTKKEATEVADSVSTLKFQIQAQTQDCNVLRSQIVQSPERIKREIVHKGENLEKAKLQLEVGAQKARGLATKVDFLNNVEVELGRLRKLVEVNLQRQQAVKDRTKQLEKMHEGLITQRQQLEALSENETQMQKQVKMVEDRLTRLSKQHDLKRAAANTDMEKIKLERQCIEDEQVQAQAKAAQFSERCAEYELKIEHLKAQHQREMEAARQELKNLYAELGEYDHRLQAACGEVMQV